MRGGRGEGRISAGTKQRENHNHNPPEEMQDLGNGWGGARAFWRQKATRNTVPETAMAVARTTACEESTEDMVGRVGEEKRNEVT